MPQRIIAVPGMKCHEQVAYYGWLAGMRKRTAWESAASCIYAVGLSDRTNDKATQLSGGQLRRLGLAQALVAQPHLLLLDEPTAGLDPAQRIRFRGLLENLVEQREVSVVVSTHQVDDLSHTFDRVVVLDRGRLIFEGSVEQFLAHSPAASEGRSQPERAYAALVDGDD
jgi:ABC-2 type transport system ATP-binding protein